MHAHHYLQYGFCDAEVIELYTPEWVHPRSVRSFFVPSDVSHQVTLKGKGRVLMVWLDPEYFFARSQFQTGDIEWDIKELEDELGSLTGKKLNCERARGIRSAIAPKAGVLRHQNLDERISFTLTWIEENFGDGTIAVEDLAGRVYLSPGRFMHLFSEQIGIPVRKYLLWQRLRKALLVMADGMSITEAAHGAGFFDSSHLNRTFKAMFGIAPSGIFKNSRFVQVVPC